jgi:hypothetical protein
VSVALDRLTAYADKPGDWTRQNAAGLVAETMLYLDFAIEDVERAHADYRPFVERLRARFEGGGEAPRQGTDTFEAKRRAYFRLLYRIDTFFVFARILLDNIPA